MRSLAVRLAAVLLACAPVLGPAQVAAQTDPVQAPILQQFDAFRAGDAALAFSFASPAIKGIFGTPDNFGAMVAQGYPMVSNPGSVRMLERRNEGGRLMQRVMVTDQAGRGHLLDYEMIETPEGWQINGVSLLPAPGVGA